MGMHFAKFVVMIAMATSGVASVSAQCTNPPTNSGNGFRPGTAVTYQFVGGGWGSEEDAVVEALDKWTSANSGWSNVSFVPSGGGSPMLTLVKTSLPAGIAGGATAPSRDGQGYITGIGIQFTNNTAYLESYTGFLKVALHELGHAQNLDDLNGGGGSSVMNQMAGKDDAGGNIPTNVTACDRNEAANEAPEPGGGGGGGDPGGCKSGEDGCTPIIVPLTGRVPRLTAPEVLFDLAGIGTPHYWAWTRPGFRAGFLVLDRNGNGSIDDGRELFGNSTPLGWGLDGPTAANGFEALAWFDGIENGGNGDGRCTPQDAVFPLLRLWIDWDHDGVSDAGELLALDAMRLSAIDLDARELEGRYDQFGNAFRWRTRILLNGRPSYAYDVVLVSGLPGPQP